MRCRPATAEDIAAVRALMLDLAPEGAVADAAHLQILIDHPGTTVWLADDGAPLACLTLHILPNMTNGGAPYALIENVVTRADRRGTGIGKTLMQHVLDVALQAGCYKVMLLTGRQRGAAGFYRACGFSDEMKTGMVVYRDRSGAARWRGKDER